MASKSAPAPEAELAPATVEATDAKPKSAADLLIEMQLQKELDAARNPLAVVEVVPVEGVKNDFGASVVQRQVFANGTVLENLA